MKHCNIHNSLIFTPPAKRTSNRQGEGSSSEASDSEAENKNFLFVFNSIAPLCRKLAAGRDGFVFTFKTHLI